MNQTTKLKHLPLEVPALDTLPRERLVRMYQASLLALDCERVLGKVKLNIVGEVLKSQGTFYQMNHYPKGDVFDKETAAQYYYHAHRGMPGEHGHFHTFMRRAGIPEDRNPVAYDGEVAWPTGKDMVTHLVGISMDKHGFAIGLFATNRWVTGEAWFKAADMIELIDSFDIDHAWPSWPVNRWMGALIHAYRPEVEALLLHRDEVVEQWRQAYPEKDVFEDRELDMTGQLRVSVKKRAAELETLLA